LRNAASGINPKASDRLVVTSVKQRGAKRLRLALGLVGAPPSDG
jgi:hypothetical protein